MKAIYIFIYNIYIFIPYKKCRHSSTPGLVLITTPIATTPIAARKKVFILDLFMTMATQGNPVVHSAVTRTASAPILQKGYIQSYDGYLRRRSKYFKRWRKEWFNVIPGERFMCVSTANELQPLMH